MKEKILALLMAKFPGVRKDGLNQVARMMALHVATEDDAKQFVEKLTDAQINDAIKEFRADVDKEVSTANRTFEANLKAKYDFVEKKKGEPGAPNPDPKPNDPNDMATIIANAVAKAIEPINKKLAGMDAENVAKSRLQRLTESLKDCKDESFKAQTLKDFNRMAFQDDAAFDEYLTEKAEDIKTANQKIANDVMNRGGGAPMFSQKDNNGVSQAVANYIQSQKPESSTNLGGKEV